MSGFSSKRCPISAEIVRAYREAFGDDCQVVTIKENGYEHGAPPAHGQQLAMPPSRPPKDR